MFDPEREEFIRDSIDLLIERIIDDECESDDANIVTVQPKPRAEPPERC